MKLKTKAQAVKIFGTQTNLAKALGITSASLCVWEDKLTQRRINEIVGAMVAYKMARIELIRR